MQSKHIESLEHSDLELLRKILNAHSKTAKEAFFLELGIYPIRYYVSMRRLMYLWHVLHRDTSELISKVYEIQKCQTVRGDWARIMSEEKAKFGISETDEMIAKMSKQKFRKMIKTKVKMHTVQYLKILAQPHSKSEKIRNNVFKRQTYFGDRRFSKDDVQLLFKLRTKMLDCKTNFSEHFNKKLQCRICNDPDSIENEDHILTCSTLNTEDYDVQFCDVFGSIDEQYKVVQVFKRVLRRRQMYLDAA